MKPSLERPLGTAFNAAGQPGQPGRCVSTVALCHLQRVQGGDQFYCQPPPLCIVVSSSLMLRCPWVLRERTNSQTCASIVDCRRVKFLQLCVDVLVASLSHSSRSSNHRCVAPEARLATKCIEMMPRQYCCTSCRHSGCMEGHATTMRKRRISLRRVVNREKCFSFPRVPS